MRIRRGLFFWALVLIPLGAIPLLVRAGQLPADRLTDAWRLWPLIVIGAGILVLGSRTWLAVVGLAVMALTIGSIGGAALAGGNFWLGSCGIGSGDTATMDRNGTLAGPASVRLDLNCGSIDVATQPGGAWTFHAAFHGPPPEVDEAADHLDVKMPTGTGGDRRQDWTVRVPPDATKSLDLSANAATARVDLDGAALNDLMADFNAGDVRIDAAEATIADIDISMNAGRVRLALSAGAATGSISVNAGTVDLCVPAAAGLRLDVEEQLTFVTNLSSRGLTRNGTIWTRPASNGGGEIDLSIDGNAASFNLDPNGGC